MRFLILIFFIFFSKFVFAQKVPSTLRFANIRLDINSRARAEIQKDVDRLLRPSKYLTKKLERAKQFFPIIESVFRDQNLPEDFKYLVLQESDLISNAVSKSNAIGFWQFKEVTALEVGLVINKYVDHRMNIIYSSKGAAKYMIKNNKHFFDNWLLALQAYQMGPGAVRRSKYIKSAGKKRMKITPRTYWYVKKFIAHKIAFQYALANYKLTHISLRKYKIKGEHNFRELSHKLHVSTDVLKEYNQWIKRKNFNLKGEIILFPSDRRLISTIKKEKEKSSLFNIKWPEFDINSIFNREIIKNEALFNAGTSHPFISKGKRIDIINDKKGIIGEEYSTLNSLALRGGISVSQFLEFNDMTIKDEIIPKQVYYFEKKSKKQKQVKYYIVRNNETLWSISQKFGIQLEKLCDKNRMYRTTKLKKGLILWLKKRRPRKRKLEYYQFPNVKKDFKSKKQISKVKAAQLNKNPIIEREKPEFFEYSIKEGDTLYSISKKYKVTINQIIKSNKNVTPENLKLGEILKIPL